MSLILFVYYMKRSKTLPYFVIFLNDASQQKYLKQYGKLKMGFRLLDRL